MWLYELQTVAGQVLVVGTALLLLYAHCVNEEERKAKEQRNRERHAWMLWMISRARARIVSRKAY